MLTCSKAQVYGFHRLRLFTFLGNVLNISNFCHFITMAILDRTPSAQYFLKWGINTRICNSIQREHMKCQGIAKNVHYNTIHPVLSQLQISLLYNSCIHWCRRLYQRKRNPGYICRIFESPDVIFLQTMGNIDSSGGEEWELVTWPNSDLLS